MAYSFELKIEVKITKDVTSCKFSSLLHGKCKLAELKDYPSSRVLKFPIEKVADTSTTVDTIG